MTVKRRDFQKIASTIHQFLLKLTDTYECAELRDSLNLSLVQLQKYYRKCQQRLQHTGRHSLTGVGGDSNGGDTGYVSPRQSLRLTLTKTGGSGGVSPSLGEPPLSPMTPYIEEPYYFHVKWTILDQQVSDKLRQQQQQENIAPNLRALNTPPVHYAAMQKDYDLLLELITAKSDVLEDQDCTGRTPLMYATYHNNIDVVRWLLKRGADPNSCDYNEVASLHWACYQNNVSMIELLLEANAAINNQDSFGRSPCHWACTCDSLDSLNLLIEYRANVNLHDRNGLTPAMWACRLDHLALLQTLSRVQNQTIDDIDGHERDRNGRSIIHWSIRRQAPLDCLKYLLCSDGMAQLRDDEGKTVLLLAAEQGALESCKLIVDVLGKEGIIDDMDDKDRTCLHLATVGGHGEVVNFLLDCGANLHAKERSGATCLDIATNHFLHYCQLIISSHVRDKERQHRESDCLELIEKDYLEVTPQATSRHNSLTEPIRFQHQKTAPRTPRSPKTPPSSGGSQQRSKQKSPTLRKRLVNYPSHVENNEEYTNGFDVMSSDPVRESLDISKEVNHNDDYQLNQGNFSSNGNNLTESAFNIVDLNTSGPVDYLNTDTGQEYHDTASDYQPIEDKVDCCYNGDSTARSIDTPSTGRPFQRAKKTNRIHGGESPKHVEEVRWEEKKEEEANIQTQFSQSMSLDLDEGESPLRFPLDISRGPAPPRINYGATLEPLRRPTGQAGQLPEPEPEIAAPRRKKRRAKQQRVAVSQERPRAKTELSGVYANSVGLSVLNRLGTDSSAKSLENISFRNAESINGILRPLALQQNDPFSSGQNVRFTNRTPVAKNISPGVYKSSERPQGALTDINTRSSEGMPRLPNSRSPLSSLH